MVHWSPRWAWSVRQRSVRSTRSDRASGPLHGPAGRFLQASPHWPCGSAIRLLRTAKHRISHPAGVGAQARRTRVTVSFTSVRDIFDLLHSGAAGGGEVR